MVTLTEAASDGAITSIAGNLSGYASSYFLIQFYENLAADPSGYGEGLFYIGSTNISTGSNGQAAFSVVLPVGVPPGRFLSATATDNANTTWELDGCRSDPAAAAQFELYSGGRRQQYAGGDRLLMAGQGGWIRSSTNHQPDPARRLDLPDQCPEGGRSDDQHYRQSDRQRDILSTRLPVVGMMSLG